MKFYVCASDQYRRIGPISLIAAKSVIRATGLAQRANGSMVWADGDGRLFIEEAGRAIFSLWVADDEDTVAYFDLVTEFGTHPQIAWNECQRSLCQFPGR